MNETAAPMNEAIVAGSTPAASLPGTSHLSDLLAAPTALMELLPIAAFGERRPRGRSAGS